MITIPKQHYIGRRTQHKDESTLPLGFATPYDDHTTKAFEKRKDTVDTWSSGWQKKDSLPTVILDNTPLDGFRIAQAVRRYGWNGGNVVWRIEDPRGFELEISSSNFASIIDCAIINKGIIEGKCIWGRDKGVNILLPENSEPYKEALTNTERAAIKVSLKDIAPGDYVILKDGRKVLYLGLYWIATADMKEQRNYGTYGYGRDTITYTYTFNTVKRRHVFTDQLDKETTKEFWNYNTAGMKNGDAYDLFIAEPKVSGILEKSVVPIDPQVTAKEIQKRFRRVIPDGIGSPTFVSSVPITDFNFEFVDLPFSKVEQQRDYKTRFAVIENKDHTFDLPIASLYDGSGQLHRISVSEIQQKGTLVIQTGETNNPLYKSLGQFKDCTWKKLVAVYNGEHHDVWTY